MKYRDWLAQKKSWGGRRWDFEPSTGTGVKTNGIGQRTTAHLYTHFTIRPRIPFAGKER